MRTRFPGFISVVVATIVACGGGDGTAPVGPPASIERLTSANLVGTVGEELATQLGVRVTDAQGRAVPNVAVTFTVTAGGGVAQPVTNSTDANGEARATWTLGTTAGAQGVRASVASVGGVDFSATAEPGPAAQLLIVSGSGQAALGGQAATNPFVVSVGDQFNNPVAGATVAWQVLSGGGQLSTASSVTDAQGRASAAATLGSASLLQQFEARMSGLPPVILEIFALTSVIDDALGDIISAIPNAPDIVQFGGTIDGDSLVIYLGFSAPVAPIPAQGAIPSNAVLLIIDIDLDQDDATGFAPIQEDVGVVAVGTYDMGVDAFLIVDTVTSSSMPMASAVRLDSIVADQPFVTRMATAARFRQSSVTVAVPLTFVEDDGNVNITTLVAGVRNDTPFVTDVAPESVNLPVAVSGPTVAARDAGGVRTEGGKPRRTFRLLLPRR